MKHKNCGGALVEDWTDPHVVQDGDGVPDGKYPRIICLKCGKEIAGDIEVEDEQ